MAYRSRSARRYIKNSRRNFFVSLVIVVLLFFAAIQWILPTVVTGVGFITGFFKSHKTGSNLTENATLAPPILNIPFEATNTGQIEIKGYATQNSKVKLFLDGEEIKTEEVSADGNFTFRNVTLSLGTNNIYAKTIDEKDRESLPSKDFRIIYDNEKPPLTLAEPEDGKKIQGGDKKVTFKGTTEINGEVFINDAQIIVDKDGNFESIQSLNEGDNNFTIKSVDLAGNITEISRRVTYSP